MATELHHSFLKPLKFTTPHTAPHIDEIAVAEKDITRFLHTANASCSYNEWLAFRGMVFAEQTKPSNANEALMLPVDREMN